MSYRDPYTHSDAARRTDEDQGYSYDRSGAYAGGAGLGSSYEGEKVVPPKSTGYLSDWRKEERGGKKMLTRGGGCRTFGRMLGCCLIFTIVLVLTIILTLALYIKPPNIVVNSVQVGSPTINTTGTTPTLGIAFTASISVSNPNYFSATLKSLDAQAFYPNVATQLGGGTLSERKFGSNTKTTFPFKFNVEYTTALDTSSTIITDIVSRCGFIVASSKKDLQINYKIFSKVDVLGIKVSPSFDGNKQFECPFTLDDIKQLGISGISGLLGSS